MKGWKKIMMEIIGAFLMVIIMVGGFCKLFAIMFDEYLEWKEGDES